MKNRVHLWVVGTELWMLDDEESTPEIETAIGAVQYAISAPSAHTILTGAQAAGLRELYDRSSFSRIRLDG